MEVEELQDAHVAVTSVMTFKSVSQEVKNSKHIIDLVYILSLLILKLR